MLHAVCASLTPTTTLTPAPPPQTLTLFLRVHSLAWFSLRITDAVDDLYQIQSVFAEKLHEPPWNTLKESTYFLGPKCGESASDPRGSPGL